MTPPSPVPVLLAGDEFVLNRLMAEELAAVAGAARSIAVVGLGSAVTPEALRYAAGSAVRQLTGATTVAFALPLADADQAAAVLEGAALGAYAFTTYRKASLAATKLPAAEITVQGDRYPEAMQRMIDR